MQIFFAHGFEVECTAHAIIEDKDGPPDAEAPLQTCQQSVQGRRISAISSQHLQMDGASSAS